MEGHPVRTRLLVVCLSVLVATVVADRASACTNILVTRGASADGSTFVTYAADSHELLGELSVTPGGVFPAGATREVVDGDSGTYLGRIPQAARTHWVVGLMNEHQVSIGETTFGGREELAEPTGILDYGSLMSIALERATTARAAVEVMTSLVAEHGYASTGESFSIADPDEVWLLELIGKGKGENGAVWVAFRLPDGTISAHANQPRIRQFPRNDPANWLYSPDVVEFARRKGYFDGADEDFSFADAYAPFDFGALRFCDSRVWSVYRRAAPSLDLPFDLVKGDPSQPRLPLFVKPDRKLAVADVFALMRDHFEGTPLDLSVGVGAGPYACPYRWRPMEWELDGRKYVHERAISTQQTGYSFVAQMRSSLPDPIGGVLWFGLDDTYLTVYTPMYCGIREAPATFAPGVATLFDFSWDSAFWVFNWVSNYTYSRWSEMVVDVLDAQRELEGRFLADQAAVEASALALHATSPDLARDHLTRYSVAMGDMVTRRWRALGEQLLVRYMDGNLKTPDRQVEHPRYPEPWYRRIVEERGEELRAPAPAPTPAPAP